MAAQESLVFTVTRRAPELITPAKPTPHEYKLLSDIDDQESHRFRMPVIYFYRKKNDFIDAEKMDPVKVIRDALSRTLVFYYPLAGRVREGAGRKLGVECTGEGVMFIEADADVTIEQLGGDAIQPPFPCMEEILFDVPGYSGVLDCPILLIQHRIPTYMKISDFYVAQAKELKILGSFVASNICRDTEGALRIPEPFLSEFGRIMPYFLQLRFDDIMWHAYFEKEEKKVCGTYDLFRYYDLRMYSFVIFDYIGKGIFKVKGYTTNAIEAEKPEIDVAQFYKNFEPSQLRFDEFVYGRNHLQIERYIAMSTMAGTNQSVDMWKIEIEGISNIAEDAHLELKPELENLYKGWEGKHHIHLCPGVNFWEISVTLVDGVCRLGHGWFKFIQDFGIADGDLLILTPAGDDSIVNVCIYKKDELAAEKKAEEKNGKRSFYKMIVESVLEEGYLVLPPMLGEKTEKNLLAVRKLKLYGMEWDIIYNSQNRIIYGLDKLVVHYALQKFDVLFFSFGKDGELLGRIFKNNGMELKVSEIGKFREELKYEEAFVYEEKNPNGHPDSAHERINTVVKQAPLPKNAVNMPDLVDIDSEPEVEVVDAPQEEEQAADMEIEDEAQVMQFSKNLNASNMNGRCHGMHIPPEIRLPNREWQHGDDVTFITAAGTWSLGLVMNNGRPRFSRGWSRFVKDNRLVKNKLVRFTLRQDEEQPTFDVDFP